ncbi:MAG: glycosyltransferase [Rhodoferax sp.]|nr:glycosyltransferase [Rhodoferax sp.]
MSIHKSICIFAAGDLFNIGGLQRSYALLTGHLVNSGHRVILVGWEKDGKVRHDLSYSLDDRVELLLVQQSRTKKNFYSIASKIKNESVDVILIVNSGFPSLFLSMIALYLGIPYVVSLRGSFEYCLRYLWPSRFALDLLFDAADAAHVLMPSYKEFFKEAVKTKIAVIPSQIESASSFANTSIADSAGRYNIIYSGRFSFEKRVHFLIESFGSIAAIFPQWDLWLVGNGPLKEDLMVQAGALGLGGRILFKEAKNTAEMYSIYPKAHIKVLPSEQEGCPMALREAMAHGLPVIAYQECSGANEIIHNGFDGFLITANPNHVTALTESLTKLMESSDLRYNLGLEAIKTAARYTPDPINKKWEELLLSACESNNGSVKNIDGENAISESRKLLLRLISNDDFRPPYQFDINEVLMDKFAFNYAVSYGSSLFDVKFYLEKYFDVKISGMDPLLHYVSVGHSLNYNPSPMFDTLKYRLLYLSNTDDSVDPLSHFISIGRFCGAVLIPISSDLERDGNSSFSADEVLKNLQRQDVDVFNVTRL